jgi:hypothetical protein
MFGFFFFSSPRLIPSQDNYKIVRFRRNGKGIAGNHLDQRFLEDSSRPVDQLLRWHFRQAVFANTRGTGEPVFECDFPPGSDIMGEIMSGPKAAELMEFELFNRLAVGDKQKTTGSQFVTPATMLLLAKISKFSITIR